LISVIKLAQTNNSFSRFFYLFQLNNGFPEVSFVNEIRNDVFIQALHPDNNIASCGVTSLRRRVNISGSMIPLNESGTTAIYAEDQMNHHLCSNSSASNSTRSTSIVNTIPSPTLFAARSRESEIITDHDDSSLYAVCQICQSKIMANRLSNLTNHVRRHALLKQFQCIHCIYTHNEIAKVRLLILVHLFLGVRLHMQNNHNDYISQPLDVLTPEMQHQWDLLMDQCFPNYSKFSINKCMGSQRPQGSISYPCVECNKQINVDFLIDHLDKVHKRDCIPYCCGQCGYPNADQRDGLSDLDNRLRNYWKVRLHIMLKHSEIAAEVDIVTMEAGSNPLIFIHKYFPDTPTTVAVKEEESQLLKELESMSSRNEQRNEFFDINLTVINGNSSDLKDVKCEICQQVLPDCESVSSLINHIKRHYCLKEYQCPECPYASSEAVHVRIHMTLRHPQVKGRPIYNNRYSSCSSSKTLQDAWTELIRQCFPTLFPKIDQLRFKYSQSEDGSEGEGTIENENDESVAHKRSTNESIRLSPDRKQQKLQDEQADDDTE
uniref:C2H2-type domain-containing protein n=1 Tax=Thelazia callipaeda TaxID=103827 RepID=A0A0N5CU57_THECL